MRALGALLLLVAIGLYYLAEVDRVSPLALTVVELDGRVSPLRLYGVAALLGLALWVPPTVRDWLHRRTRAGPTVAGHRPAQQRARADQHLVAPGAGGPRPWREAILSQVRGWDGGQGARILVDQSHGVPFTLHLEHLSPRHCERAVAELALLLQQLPQPPRVRIEFDQCPEGPAPRHHLVSKALGTVLTHGSFKAVPVADQVEVQFFAPDPRYRTEW